MYTHIYTCTHMHMCVCIYIYIYIHIRTHTHTHTRAQRRRLHDDEAEGLARHPDEVHNGIQGERPSCPKRYFLSYPTRPWMLLFMLLDKFPDVINYDILWAPGRSYLYYQICPRTFIFMLSCAANTEINKNDKSRRH